MTRRARPLAAASGAVLAALALATCATEGGREGGAAHLPDRGITGWTRTETDAAAPYALSVPGTLLGGASALVVGDRIVIFGHETLADGHLELFRSAESATAGEFSPPSDLGIAGRDPSVVVADGTFWLAYVDANGLVAIATGSDGTTFTPRDSSGIAADRAAPSIVVEGDRVRLYLATGTTIVVTEATLGALSSATRGALAFGPETTVLEPASGCTDANGKDKTCWDHAEITEAEVRRATTPTGDVVYRMFYAADAGGDTDLGFAASYDGVAFTRFAFNPVYSGTFDERSPTSVIARDTYYLFWEETRAVDSGGIARAVHVPSAPADRW